VIIDQRQASPARVNQDKFNVLQENCRLEKLNLCVVKVEVRLRSSVGKNYGC